MDKILAAKLLRGKLLYRASWVGYDEDLNFYPASDFKYSPHKLRNFHTEYPQQPGPPRRLVDWIKAWEQGRDSYEDLADDRPDTPTRLPRLRAPAARRGG